MNPSACQWLDDYLAHDLADDKCARFTDHLADCADCRRAVSEHQRLGALLEEATAAVPAGLTERVERRLRIVRWRRVAVAATALAASVAIIWLFSRPLPRPTQPEPPLAQVQPEPSAPEMPQPADRVRITFPADANVFAVPIKTDSPNVTFVWVFPDLRAARQPAPAANDPPSSAERSDS